MSQYLVSEKLKPFICSDLMRIGRDYDGGYLVSQKDVESSEAIVSLGVCDDWSFEREFRELNKVPVRAYDRSVGLGFFIGLVFRKVLRVEKPLQFVKAVRVLFSYLRFFNRSDIIHERKFVGGDAPPKLITLKTAAKPFAGKKKFFKVDIEGSEYRCLDDLLELADETTGLAIEFHDCDLHEQRIIDFVAAYPLKLVHLSVNLSGGLYEKDRPMVVELTFSSSAKGRKKVKQLPHELDMPNAPGMTLGEVSFI